MCIRDSFDPSHKVTLDLDRGRGRRSQGQRRGPQQSPDQDGDDDQEGAAETCGRWQAGLLTTLGCGRVTGVERALHHLGDQRHRVVGPAARSGAHLPVTLAAHPPAALAMRTTSLVCTAYMTPATQYRTVPHQTNAQPVSYTHLRAH